MRIKFCLINWKIYSKTFNEFLYLFKLKIKNMSSKYFGNSKVKGPSKDKNNKKIKSGGSMKSTTAIRKTGRGN